MSPRPPARSTGRSRRGVGAIEIEERAAEEVTHIAGVLADGTPARVRLAPEGTRAANPAFDVTPARLITGIVTERGVAEASFEGLAAAVPGAPRRLIEALGTVYFLPQKGGAVDWSARAATK